MKVNTLAVVVAFTLIMQACPCTYASEIDAEAVLNKFAAALRGEGVPGEIFVMGYSVATYDENSGNITIQYCSGASASSATTKRRELPVLFVLPEDKKKLQMIKESGRLGEIVVTGYIDEEYKCFVCLDVSDPMGVEFVFP